MFQNNQFPGYSESKPSTIFFFCWHTADTSLPEISNKQMNFISIWTQDPGQRDSLSSANIFIKKNRNAFEESFQHSFFWTIEIVFDPQNLFQQPDSKVWTGLELSSGKTTYSQFIWHSRYWSESQSFMKNVKNCPFSTNTGVSSSSRLWQSASVLQNLKETNQPDTRMSWPFVLPPPPPPRLLADDMTGSHTEQTGDIHCVCREESRETGKCVCDCKLYKIFSKLI